MLEGSLCCVVVLRKRNGRFPSIARKLDANNMVILWQIGLPRKRTEMDVLDHLLFFYLQNFAGILICFSFPFSFPNNRAAFLPIRNDIRPEHVLLDYFRISEGVPHLSDGNVDSC